MFRNITARGIARVFLWLLVGLASGCLMTPQVLAQTNPFVGKWGYTMLGRALPGQGQWHTWKTELGTIEFFPIPNGTATGVATSTYAESADNCPDSNYCKVSDTQNHSYVVNTDGTATLDGVVKIVISGDGKMVILDGTSVPDEQVFLVGVKLDSTHTYTSTDAIGDFYSTSYEYDAEGNPPPAGGGRYRLSSVVSSLLANGTWSMTGKTNGDGTVYDIPPQGAPVQQFSGTYSVNSSGLITLSNGFGQTAPSGYSGDGKVAVFSNTHSQGGLQNDFFVNIALKKQDRTYSTADLQGTWAYTGFGDSGGTTFRSGFGTITCDQNGSCAVSTKGKMSDGTTSNTSSTISLTASSDGAINGFSLTGATPHSSGAIGNNGNIMILVMNASTTSTDDRVLRIAVKVAQSNTSADETAIRDGFAAAIQAYNNKDITTFMSYFSPNYLDHGQNYAQFMAEMSANLSDPHFQPFSFTITNVTIDGTNATISITWGNGGKDFMYLRKEGDTWKVYGNQEKYDIWAGSVHQQYFIDGTPSGHYYGAIDVRDPNQTISSVSATGTNINGSLAFTYQPGSKAWWPESIDFGTIQPSNAAYIITITDGSGTYTYSRIINGGIADFAANLSPSGNVSGAINFSFTGIPNGQEYEIELYDSNHNRIWNSDKTSATTDPITVSYTGNTLIPGIYSYQVKAVIRTVNGDNESFARGQFTYTGNGTGGNTITFTGSVADISGNAISGALIEKAGDASINTTTDASGNFTLTGLPSNTVFHIKISKSTYISVYTANIKSTSNVISQRTFKLFTADQITGQGWPGMNVIAGFIADASSQSALSGAFVSAVGLPSNTAYEVAYDGSGNATSASGRYQVLNVSTGDTVTVTARLSGYTFAPRTFVIHSDGMNEGTIYGTESGSGGADITSIVLTQGWNFVSFPKLPSASTDIGTVLADVSGSIRIVWGFDNSSKTWKKYKPGAAGNSLSSIDLVKGYWIYADSAATINLAGWTAVSGLAGLGEGWNLVGYAGTDGTDINTALSGVSGKWIIIWSWVDGQWYAKQASTSLSIPSINMMNQGMAYWIKMNVATVWAQ